MSGEHVRILDRYDTNKVICKTGEIYSAITEITKYSKLNWGLRISVWLILRDKGFVRLLGIALTCYAWFFASVRINRTL